MAAPIVFISYSHDSPEHKRWVLDFAIRLRTSGVDAILDQWDLGPGSDLPQFMEQNIKRATRVIMICTERYVQKADSGTGGVGYERMIVTADLMKTIGSTTIIPVIRQKGLEKVTPAFLATKKYIDLSNADVFESGMDELLRDILAAPLYIKPPLGNDPFSVSLEPPKQKAPGPVEKFMSAVGALYEQADDSGLMGAGWIKNEMNTSNLLYAFARDQAIAQGLVRKGGANTEYLWVTDQGRAYLVQNGSKGE